MKTMDAGKSWHPVTYEPDPTCNSVSPSNFTFKDSLIGWASCPGNTYSYKSTDAGENWSYFVKENNMDIYYKKDIEVVYISSPLNGPIVGRDEQGNSKVMLNKKYPTVGIAFSNDTNGIFQTIAHPKTPIVIDTLSSVDCDALAGRGNSYVYYGKYRWGYDSLKYYIEQCALQSNSRGEFSEITSAAQGLAGIGQPPGGDSAYVWKEYKMWLKSVLNLNPDHQYFCGDVFQLAAIYENFSDTSNTMPDWNAVVTICRYSEDSLNCGKSSSSSNEYLIKEARRIQHARWQDTVKDSLKTPLDTNLKTLDQLGLGYLRGYTSGVATTLPKNENTIANLSAIKNPFNDEVELQYTLNSGATIRIEIYDILGKIVWSDGQGYHPPNESSSVKIDTKNWSPGTYLARFSTFSNEVKTVKLVHEK